MGSHCCFAPTLTHYVPRPTIPMPLVNIFLLRSERNLMACLPPQCLYPYISENIKLLIRKYKYEKPHKD